MVVIRYKQTNVEQKTNYELKKLEKLCLLVSDKGCQRKKKKLRKKNNNNKKTINIKMNKKQYLIPAVQVKMVAVENGFQLSLSEIERIQVDNVVAF